MMKNRINSLEAQLSAWCKETFAAGFPEADLGGIEISVLPARNEQFGDCQCEAAMKLAGVLKMNPRAVAQRFVESALLPDSVEKVDDVARLARLLVRPK